MEMKTSGLFIFLSSPVLTSLTELRTKNMHFSDIAPHDITRDLILFNQQRIAEVRTLSDDNIIIISRLGFLPEHDFR